MLGFLSAPGADSGSGDRPQLLADGAARDNVGMDAAEDPVAVVACLLDEPWDGRWNSLEVAGVDLVSIYTRMEGCTYTWITNGGSLHERGMATVRFISDEIERVLPELAEHDSVHVWHRLHRMAQLMVDHNNAPVEASS
ncbi:hypothetical protein ACE1OC_40900 [Streptomyces sp. DSM 116496]|uniref:hypothetical protein n=1 Tax=Streptomyces stoeckheimensis TaxID=3344656 RepID=UPI0038B30534